LALEIESSHSWQRKIQSRTPDEIEHIPLPDNSIDTDPGPRVHPEVVAAMSEVGLDLSEAPTSRLTTVPAQSAEMLITMGCGDRCPIVPGLKRDDWPLEDPRGKPFSRVREIRDDIRQRVESLLEHEGWRRTAGG
jgi:arsenate reductase